MAALSALARPYAQAAYEFALSQQDVAAWDALFAAATLIIEQPALQQLLTNVLISSEQWFTLLSELLQSYLNEQRKNFLQLLCDNKRVAMIPAITQLFKEYDILNKQAAEVEITTAIPLNDQQKQQLMAKLTKLLNYQVSLRCLIDANILGGAVVRAGDKVIDGSVRGQLMRLHEFAIR